MMGLLEGLKEGKESMKDHKGASLRLVTAESYDVGLIKNIADIEQLVQPFDSWNEQDITGLLTQDINKCWTILNPDWLNEAQAEDNGKVMAYCIFSQVFEIAEILRIGTHPDFQRRGLAEWLLKTMIEQMPNKQLDRILLEVREDNNAAIYLYQKMGFKIINIRKGYYTSRSSNESEASCDALVMQYILEESKDKETYVSKK